MSVAFKTVVPLDFHVTSEFCTWASLLFIPSVSLRVFFCLFCFNRTRSLLMVGDDSPHIDDVVDMNGRMLPEETDFIKVPADNEKYTGCHCNGY